MGEQVVVERRTQKERKAATIDKLVKATISAIVDFGYQKASIAVICELAGVSQGALFRHFASRKALIIEVAENVSTYLATEVMEKVQNRGKDDEFMAIMADAIWDVMHSPEQAVLRELKVAARTDSGLRSAIMDSEVRFNQKLHFMVEAITVGLNVDTKTLVDAIYLVIRCLDGLAMSSCLHKNEGESDAVRQLLFTSMEKEFGHTFSAL